MNIKISKKLMGSLSFTTSFIEHCNLGDFPHTKKLSWLGDAHVTFEILSQCFVQQQAPLCLLHYFTSFHHLICLFLKFLVPSTFKVL
jgi:hypothetical protein